jgi:hypothetical protein
VHLPLLRGSLLTAGLLVFVDVMKELPATLVMRPFNFDTLATQAYTLAADERLAEASTAALAIVAVGILPLIAVSRQIAKGNSKASGCLLAPDDAPALALDVARDFVVGLADHPVQDRSGADAGPLRSPLAPQGLVVEVRCRHFHDLAVSRVSHGQSPRCAVLPLTAQSVTGMSRF